MSVRCRRRCSVQALSLPLLHDRITFKVFSINSDHSGSASVTLSTCLPDSSEQFISLQTNSMDVFPFPVQDRFTFPDESKSNLEATYEIRNADVGDCGNNDAPPGIGAVREQPKAGRERAL